MEIINEVEEGKSVESKDNDVNEFKRFEKTSLKKK